MEGLVAHFTPQDPVHRPRTSHSTVQPLRRSCLQVHGLHYSLVALVHLWGRSVYFQDFEAGHVKILELGVDEPQNRGG